MQRTALITGASGVIGLEIARLFAADKWDVALVARTEPKLRELAAQLEKEHGLTAHVVAADLARPEAAATSRCFSWRPVSNGTNNVGVDDNAPHVRRILCACGFGDRLHGIE
jgi:short-subunit dehydrogenase